MTAAAAALGPDEAEEYARRMSDLLREGDADSFLAVYDELADRAVSGAQLDEIKERVRQLTDARAAADGDGDADAADGDAEAAARWDAEDQSAGSDTTGELSEASAATSESYMSSRVSDSDCEAVEQSAKRTRRRRRGRRRKPSAAAAAAAAAGTFVDAVVREAPWLATKEWVAQGGAAGFDAAAVERDLMARWHEQIEGDFVEGS